MWHFSAFFSSALTLNHCAWTVLAGSALSKGLKSQWFLVAYIFVAHFVCTGTSLYNQTGECFLFNYYFIILNFFIARILKFHLGTIWPAMASTWLSVLVSGSLAFKEAGFKVFNCGGKNPSGFYHTVAQSVESDSVDASSGEGFPSESHLLYQKTKIWLFTILNFWNFIF